MSTVKLTNVKKIYGKDVVAVRDFNLDIADKEFVVFVGPSGCGKSTTLRMIAGLEDISEGTIEIDGVVVNDLQPKDRDIAMVFQNYALYPHLTVFENMAFSLRLKKVKQDEVFERVTEAAKILGITELLLRKPRALSGGQRQRVAIGRAIVREPKVFLLDEPLSNLDAKLRNQMRAEIILLRKKINTTFVYVTHDQTEAMTLGDRIVVMKDGLIQQIDKPRNLYNYPANKFVAGFIGTPQMNFFDAKLIRKGDKVEMTILGTDNVLTLPAGNFKTVKPEYLTGERTVTLGIRTEKISADPGVVAKNPEATVVCTVSHAEELGNEALVFADLAGDTEAIGIGKTNITFKTDNAETVVSGEKVRIAFDIGHLHFFDAETEQSICPRNTDEETDDHSEAE